MDLSRSEKSAIRDRCFGSDGRDEKAVIRCRWWKIVTLATLLGQTVRECWSEIEYSACTGLSRRLRGRASMKRICEKKINRREGCTDFSTPGKADENEGPMPSEQ